MTLATAGFPDVERLPDGLIPMVTSSRRSAERFRSQGGRLADVADALVYLGPEPDRDLTGTIPFSRAEERELERRDRVGRRATLEIRYRGRDQWFREHPEDLPRDPRKLSRE